MLILQVEGRVAGRLGGSIYEWMVMMWFPVVPCGPTLIQQTAFFT